MPWLLLFLWGLGLIYVLYGKGILTLILVSVLKKNIQHVQNQSLILKKSKNSILLILRSFGWEIPKSEVGAPKLVLWWIDKVLLKFLQFVFQRLSWQSWSLIAILSCYHIICLWWVVESLLILSCLMFSLCHIFSEYQDHHCLYNNVWIIPFGSIAP